MRKLLMKLMAAVLVLSSAGSASYAYAETDEPLILVHSSLGDVNGDNDLSAEDLTYFSGYLMGSNELVNENADISRDGNVNIADYIILKENMIRSSEAKNEEEPLTYEDKELEFYHAKEPQTVIFDALEQQVFEKLCAFREKFGVSTNVFYRSVSYACDKTAEYYANTRSYPWPELYMYSAYHSYFIMTVYSSDPEEIFRKAISNYSYKGTILHGRYYLCIGHYNNCWVIMTAG